MNSKLCNIFISTLIITFFNISTSYGDGRLENKIKSIGLFKNGLAIIEEEVIIPKSGTWKIKNVPRPIHGTYWIESEQEVKIVSGKEWVDVPADKLDPFNAFAGKKVKVYFENNHESKVNEIYGEVMEYQTTHIDNRDINYNSTRNPGNWFSNWFISTPRSSNTSTNANSHFLWLEVTKDGHKSQVMIRKSDINRLTLFDGSESVTPKKRIQKPYLKFIANDTSENFVISIFYLTKGIAWAPSYKIILTDKSNLSLIQKAVIKNEWRSFENVKVSLISGFPNVEFGHLMSPLSAETQWSLFFQNATQNRNNNTHLTQQLAMFSNTMITANASPNSVLPDRVPGQGKDIHYQSIGTLSLANGESTLSQTATGDSKYRRIVNWEIPDSRDAQGRPRSNDRYDYGYNSNQNKLSDSDPWDVVEFSNPLEFPMTTAPAMVLENVNFLGQSLSYFINPGEINQLKITKALSVQTSYSEREIEETRKNISIGGSSYYQVEVQGKIKIKNKRMKDLVILINRKFSGDLIEADLNPQSELLEEGVYEVNARNQLKWELDIPAGESKELNYKYKVLVKR